MKKRNYVIILVMLLVIGFASVAANLNINGNVGVGSNIADFDVYFSKTIVDDVENNKLIKDDTHISFVKDMSLVGEKFKLEYDVTNGSKNYDASLTINCTASNEYLTITNEFDTANALLASNTRRGTLTIEVIKAHSGSSLEPTKDMEITCEIVASALERENLSLETPANKVVNWKLSEDNDNNGEVSIGDLITFDTESFYVYNVGENNIKALAQYNLDEGFINNDGTYENITVIENPTGLQNSLAIAGKWSSDFVPEYPRYGAVFYSTEKIKGDELNSYTGSLIESYVEKYLLKLDEIGASIESIGLITKEELLELGCDEQKKSCRRGYRFAGSWVEDQDYLTGAPDFVYSVSYWTSSPYNTTGTNVWGIDSRGIFSNRPATADLGLGVRPVIEISKSLFE